MLKYKIKMKHIFVTFGINALFWQNEHNLKHWLHNLLLCLKYTFSTHYSVYTCTLNYKHRRYDLNINSYRFWKHGQWTIYKILKSTSYSHCKSTKHFCAVQTHTFPKNIGRICPLIRYQKVSGPSTIRQVLHWPCRPGWPFRPLRPGCPCGPICPVGPCNPVAPTSPFCPVAPWIPGWPTDPALPAGPSGPCAPVNPDGPENPVAPVKPAVPFSPCWPVNPCCPGDPCWPFCPWGPTDPEMKNRCYYCIQWLIVSTHYSFTHNIICNTKKSCVLCIVIIWRQL